VSFVLAQPDLTQNQNTMLTQVNVHKSTVTSATSRSMNDQEGMCTGELGELHPLTIAAKQLPTGNIPRLARKISPDNLE
jgi:hypothetical protein